MTHGRLTGLMIVLLTVMFRPSAGEACFCLADCAEAVKAEAIFEATVVAVESGRRTNPNGTYSLLPNRVRLTDVRAWRGQPADVVMTGVGGGNCGYDFRVGTRYVIVATRQPKDGQLWTSICSMTRPLAEAGSFREYVDSLSAPSRGGHVWGRVARGRVVANSQETPMTVAEPIVGARVSLQGPASRTVATGADGRFTVAALPPGQYTVDVSLPREAERLGSVQTRTVTLEEGYACAALDLWTHAAGVVEGTVADEDGRPVPGFLVYLQPIGYRVFGPRTANAAAAMGEKTDADGRYRIAGVPPGRYVIGSSIMVGPTAREPFAVTYGRTSSGDTELAVEEPGASLTVEPIVLRRLTPRRVTGRVMWSDGQPAAGLTIGAAPIGERGTIPAVTSTTIGDQGGFALPLFDDARFEITVSRDRRVIHRSQLLITHDPIVMTLAVP